MDDVFTPSRLRLARQRRGLTVRALATQLEIPERNLSHYETGTATPPEGLVNRLAEALDVQPVFFSMDDVETVPVEAISFRALSKMSARQRDAAIAAGFYALEVDTWISARFRRPAPDVPTLDHPARNPEAAAREVRARWGMGEAPAPNMVHLLEAHGVRVYSLATDCSSVDAYSTWWRALPYVFLNTMKSRERGRFDAAHELGHLVMHGADRAVHGPEAERQANQFASAFLMPAADVLPRGLRHATIDRVLREKKRWRVSAMSLTHRLNELGLLSEWGYRSLCIELSKRGYRSAEPDADPTRETSQVLTKVFRSLWEQRRGAGEIADAVGISIDELNRHMFGLVMTAHDGQGRANGPIPTREPLRLVR